MRIGTAIALLVIGAILAFAVNVQVAWFNLSMIGYILMVAGVILLVISLVVGLRGSSSTSTTRTGYDADGNRIERRDDYRA
ncbi:MULTISPECIES: DUF6458 family protein [unclassified Curtobacterium]|uniref:DUF6458 family protein n=1 Tax=unclassified Curtobacterium TaxID=257496 RepID=UPI000DA7F290|nr:MULTISPECIES: DUF6458 family protein [unclassified Curtobacterium]PZE24171.1 hypothetical protein DEI86_12965 [Curtobacterium sp. MCBD17_028]PZE73379.1 hypothetical protein DEI82_14435 [Curtobacterium sp. MCBD17_019]PZF58131.1 hypothetical protein DEI81_14795 [Curtobacterium sp. MCBD17_013]WIB63501.1 DUF6458 family protein [Curtobacterium sp. MCBD17_040]WIB67330.1 DUF6458 family protein [Curtobacterium sp. MCBD17_035]